MGANTVVWLVASTNGDPRKKRADKGMRLHQPLHTQLGIGDRSQPSPSQ